MRSGDDREIFTPIFSAESLPFTPGYHLTLDEPRPEALSTVDLLTIAPVLELTVAAHPPPVLPENALRDGFQHLGVRGQHFRLLSLGPVNGGELHLW